MTRTRRSAWLAATLTVAGCGSLIPQQPDPGKAYFTLPTATASETPPATRPAGTGVAVRPLRVRPPFDGQAFVYRTGPAGVTTDYYANWVAAPGPLLTGALSDHLAAGGLGGEPAGVGRASAVLDGEVTELSIDRSDAARRRAVVAVRFTLTEPGSTAVWSAAYTASADLAGDSPAAAATAWGTAYAELLGRLVADLRRIAPPESGGGARRSAE